VITVTLTANALENAISQKFVSPRNLFTEHFIHNGRTGCNGVGNKSGWQKKKKLDACHFDVTFISHNLSYLENVILLVLDKHS